MTNQTTTELLNNAGLLAHELVIITSEMGTTDHLERLKVLQSEASEGVFHSKKALLSGAFVGDAYEEVHSAFTLYSRLESATYNLEYLLGKIRQV